MTRIISQFSIFLISLIILVIPIVCTFTITSFSSELGIAHANHVPGHASPGSSASCPPDTLCNPLQFSDLVSVIVAIADILLILAVPIIIIFIVYAGFLYVTAQGNSSKIQDAHRALLYALIGGAIILGAKVISAIIANTVNSITP